RGDQGRLVPVPPLERDLRDLLSRTETVVGDATPEAFGPKAVVNAAAEFPGQVGAGFPWSLVDGKIFGGEKGGCDAAQTAAALAVRFEAGVLLRRRVQHFELSGHQGFFPEVGRARSVRNRAQTHDQRLTSSLDSPTGHGRQGTGREAPHVGRSLERVESQEPEEEAGPQGGGPEV